MFPSDDNVDLTSIVRKARKASRGLKVIDDRRDSFRGGRRGDLSRLEFFMFGTLYKLYGSIGIT